MGVGIPISFKRQPTRDDSAAILAPEQQRRVIEYGFGEAAARTSPDGTSANGRTAAGGPAWIDRALDALEPAAD
jgi:hypothetical protein